MIKYNTAYGLWLKMKVSSGLARLSRPVTFQDLLKPQSCPARSDLILWLFRNQATLVCDRVWDAGGESHTRLHPWGD